MAASRRNKALARWAVVAGTGLVGLSFWVAVLRGPSPANNTPASPSTAQQSGPQVSQQLPNAQAGSAVGPSSPSLQSPSQSVLVQRPRFRTRAS